MIFPRDLRLADALWNCTTTTIKKMDVKEGYSNVLCKVELGTGTPPLTLFFETLKNRVSRKPCCQRSDLVLKLQNETASSSKVHFFQQLSYSNSQIMGEIKPFLSSCTFIFDHIFYCAFFIILILVGIDKKENPFGNNLE